MIGSRDVLRCFVCNEVVPYKAGISLITGMTSYSNSKLPKKIVQLVGENFMVIVSISDMLCKRCYILFNKLDKLELEMQIVKKILLDYLNRKYQFIEEVDEDVAENSSAEMLDAENISSQCEVTTLSFCSEILHFPSLNNICYKKHKKSQEVCVNKLVHFSKKFYTQL